MGTTPRIRNQYGGRKQVKIYSAGLETSVSAACGIGQAGSVGCNAKCILGKRHLKGVHKSLEYPLHDDPAIPPKQASVRQENQMGTQKINSFEPSQNAKKWKGPSSGKEKSIKIAKIIGIAAPASIHKGGEVLKNWESKDQD